MTKELMNNLETAYKLLGDIAVKGDSVDLLAAAKEQLRRAYRIAQVQQEEEQARQAQQQEQTQADMGAETTEENK